MNNIFLVIKEEKKTINLIGTIFSTASATRKLSEGKMSSLKTYLDKNK